MTGVQLKSSWEKHILGSIFGKKVSKDSVKEFRKRISYNGLYRLYDTIGVLQEENRNLKIKVDTLEEEIQKIKAIVTKNLYKEAMD